MKHLIYILLLLTSTAFGQISYNPIDTTFTFTYAHLQSIKNSIESCKVQRSALEREIVLLEDIRTTQDIKIKKLIVRDSLYQKELELYKEMDRVMMDKAYKANEIIKNQGYIIISTENQLKIETKKAKREKFWKNVYKFSYPAAILITGFIILAK